MRRRNLREDDFPRGTKVIYDRLINIEVKTRPESHYPDQFFRHKFPKGTKVYGLPDGSILIRSDTDERLWDEIDFREEE
jgi:hypothetical protein